MTCYLLPGSRKRERGKTSESAVLPVVCLTSLHPPPPVAAAGEGVVVVVLEQVLFFMIIQRPASDRACQCFT